MESISSSGINTSVGHPVSNNASCMVKVLTLPSLGTMLFIADVKTAILLSSKSVKDDSLL